MIKELINYIELYWHYPDSTNPLQPNVAYLYPLKIPECFQGV